MPTECLLGVDLGTTTLKTLITGVDGGAWATDTRPTPWRHPADGGTETDPDGLITAAMALMRSVIEQVVETTPDARVVAVGITGMAETGVLLDTTGTPVAPAVAWHDPRSSGQSERLDPELGGGQFPRATGLPISPRSSAVTYRWLRETRPETQAGRVWLDMPAYLAYCLCGTAVADRSLAARSGFLDLVDGTWSETLMEWAGAPKGMLPPIVQSGTAVGNVHHTHARLDGAITTVAGHDHLVASVGAGALAPADAFDSCGTGEAIIRQLPSPHAFGEGAPHSALDRDEIAAAVADGLTVGWHVLSGRQIVMAGLGSGRILQRFLALLGAKPGQSPLDQLDQQALAAPPGAGGLAIQNLAEAACALVGIPWDPTPGLVWRAALEAVTQRGAHASSLLDTYAGSATRLVATGGWLCSPAVRGIKAEGLGSYDIPQVDEAGARGAALLAALAAGYYQSSDELPTPKTTTVTPPTNPTR